MTIASDLGFVVGKEYEVLRVKGWDMVDSGVKVGDYALFIKDDGSHCPRFIFNNVEFYAYISGTNSIEIIPKEKPKMKKEFTKEDLIGKVVELRNNNRYFLVKAGKSVIGFNLENTKHTQGLTDTWYILLNSDFIYITNPYDVMKVFSLEDGSANVYNICSQPSLILIWEREEKTEQQLQIEKLEATIKQAQEELKQLKEMK